MTESRLHKNKKKKEQAQESSTPVDSKPKQHDVSDDNVTVLRYVRLLWLPALLVGLVLTYMNPKPVTDILDSWIGFSEHWDPAQPASSKNVFVSLHADIPKRDAVVAAFKSAWLVYEKDAMGDDEYHPLSQKGHNLSEAGGIGYMIIDSIDSMKLMGLEEEYLRAREWVANKMTLDRDDNFNTFETTIRVLGGLLSAYHLSSGDTVYLDKAIELADRILPVFETPSGLPHAMINLARREGVPNNDLPNLVSTAEVATIQLEFRYLSFLTGNDDYWRRVENVMRIIKDAKLPHGLASIFINVDIGKFATSAIRLGSRGDSFYEYLLKQYIQTNSSEPVYRDMYDEAIEAVHKHLIQMSTNSKMTYTAELIPERGRNGEISWRLTPKQDHLVCFFGGSLMLGATTTGALVHPVSIPPLAEELSDAGKRDWKTGVELVKTCMDTHDTATGLSPEIVHFRIPSDGMDKNVVAPSDWYIKGAKPGEFPPYDARYMLRPETVESLFLAFRLSGDTLYRDYGWKIFQSIEKHCRVKTGGYTTVINVDEVPVRHEDKMETFFLSETLKYLFLLFEDASVLPLDKYVFNTEAHPLPIFKPTLQTGFT